MPAVALPFVGPKFKVEIKLQVDPGLAEDIEAFVKEQQKNNAQLTELEEKKVYSKLISALVRKYLKSQGYYNHSVSQQITEEGIILGVQPGRRSLIEKVIIKQPEFISQNLKDKLLAAQAELRPDQPLIADNVLGGQQWISNFLVNNYCLFDAKLKRKITLDSKTQKAWIVYTLESSPNKSVSSVTIEGLETIDPEFFLNNIDIPRKCFKRSSVSNAQIQLLQTGLLASATPSIVPLDDSSLKVNFKVSERKHKSQSVGIGYSTEEQIRLTLGWENRNWRGNGKKLETGFKISQLITRFDTDLTIPQFKRKYFDLLFHGDVEKSQVEAFDATSATVSVNLDYKPTTKIITSIGVQTEYSKEETALGQDIFRLVSLPLSVRYDTSNDLLNPTQGFVVSGRVQPFKDLSREDTQFNKITTSLKYYLTPDWGNKRLTLAQKFALGSITGAELTRIPSTKRYYSGGGGSVRGFDFQSLSPRRGDEILGGRSFIEVASELRIKISKSWGAGVFVDAGTSSASSTPDFSQELSVGAGFGIRYFTSFAPVRVDLAWPISSPLETESTPQLYVGLKQAF